MLGFTGEDLGTDLGATPDAGPDADLDPGLYAMLRVGSPLVTMGVHTSTPSGSSPSSCPLLSWVLALHDVLGVAKIGVGVGVGVGASARARMGVSTGAWGLGGVRGAGDC